MNITLTIVIVLIIGFASCRDFYVGMFKKNDWLVAQDRLYKERILYKHMYAKYGRVFKCKITYFRVADRLGYGPGPKVQIVRGGLTHKYIVLKLTSPYNMPISVNIYVGCANTFTTTQAPTSTSVNDQQTTQAIGESQNPAEVTATEAKSNDTDSGQTAANAAAATTVAATAAG